MGRGSIAQFFMFTSFPFARAEGKGRHQDGEERWGGRTSRRDGASGRERRGGTLPDEARRGLVMKEESEVGGNSRKGRETEKKKLRTRKELTQKDAMSPLQEILYHPF